MGTTTVDLFRVGNASGPRLEKVRPGIDIEVYRKDGEDWVKGRSGGASTFESKKDTRKTWWRLPAGTKYDDRLFVWNDQDDHWSWEPASDMRLLDYVSALEAVNVDFTRV